MRVIYEHQRSARRFSAPPLCRRDLSRGYYHRSFWPGYLDVDADVKQDFSTIETISEQPSRSLYIINDTLCLKLLPICLDIDAIVHMMRAASQVVPVPRVHRYGRSGNCCYILTDFIRGEGFYHAWILAKKVPLWIILARLEKSVRRAVEGLQGLGIAHHDFHYTNLIVDRYWGIAAVYDWDYAVEGPGQEEYPRRAAEPTYPRVWDYLFAGSSAPFGTPFTCSPVDGNPDDYDFTPALAGSRATSTAWDADHHLDPLICAQNLKAPNPVMVVLRGGDGSPVISYLDEHAGSIHGLHIARVFTDEKPSETLRQRSIATTSYADVVHPLNPVQLIDFVAEHAMRTIDDEFARLVVRECPALVILVNWRLPLANKFYEGLEWEMDLLNPNSVPTICRVNMYESHYPSPPESQPGLVLRCVHAHVSIPPRFGQQPGFHLFTYSSTPVDAQDGQLLSYTAEYIESLAVRAVVQNYNAERSQWNTQG